jgi:flagellin-like protein
MQKRGLSNIVATVLVVLLALAAVAVVWTLIVNLLNTDDLARAQEEIDLLL